MPPPAIFAVTFLVALWIEGAFHRLRIADVDGLSRPLIIAGGALATAGILVAIWGVLAFRRHHTTVLPFHRARSLVRSGPYRFTRNPMYLGMVLVNVGGALALNAVWPILLLPVAIAFLVVTVIRKEEAHLAQAFPDEYAAYRARVRRWL